MFCTLVYLRFVRFSLSSVVKRFEFLKALYKFPIIIITSQSTDSVPLKTMPRTTPIKISLLIGRL